jgi:hypothetical protein
MTQKLAMHRNIATFQTLTETHDSISSWSGIGSALATLYNQLSTPASVLQTLNIVGYLGCISGLNISIPAIISVEAFNNSYPLMVETRGIPEFWNTTTLKYAIKWRSI